MADTKMAAILFSVFLTCMLFKVAVSQPDTAVCKATDFAPGATDPKKPSLPVMYDVGIECNIQNRKFTTYYHEFYDLENKRTAVHIYGNNAKSSEIFSFNTNELFSIDYTKTCSVQNLTAATDLYLFGTKSGASSKAQIFTANGALEFGKTIPEKYIGNATIRGVLCNQWRSCVYWPGRKATMTVDWYFSVPGWKTTENITSVPVRAHVKGTVLEGNNSRPFEHTYDFADFRSNVQKLTVFETPSGVYCPHRKVTKLLPKPPRQFHFTSEMLKPVYQQISRIKEWYNLDMNLVWYEYQPFSSNDPYGVDLQTQVHDFNTGVAYIIDNTRGNCSMTAIKSTGFDVRNADPTHVRIRTSADFFSFSKSAYTYEGTKSARGILCDVWILQRNDWPTKNANVTSTWQWFFATRNYNENFPDRPTFGLPVMMTLSSEGIPDYTYNIYGYDELQPQLWSYDVSKCYNFTAKKDFKFYLPGSFRDLASTNIDSLKYAVVNALQIIIPGLSVLRINNILIDYADNNDIIVQFTLLDKAPVPGDVVNPQFQVDLTTAVGKITNAIKGGYFVVNLKTTTTGTVTKITAKPYSSVTDHIRMKYVYTQPSKSSSGFSGGAMAGLAVGMLVAFFAMGVGAMYIYYRKLGGAFLPKKFDNTDITQDTT